MRRLVGTQLHITALVSLDKLNAVSIQTAFITISSGCDRIIHLFSLTVHHSASHLEVGSAASAFPQ